jgi:helix-turn-helix protein
MVEHPHATLDEIAADPAMARKLTPDARAAALMRCASVLAALAAAPVDMDASSESNGSLAVLTTKHLAEMWQMPEAKIRELCRTGSLPARKLGPKEWVICADALRDWLPRAPIAKDVSLRLSPSHESGRRSQTPHAAAPYTVVVRRSAGRSQNQGGRDKGHERDDGTTIADHRAAATARLDGAAPKTTSKGTLT